jgi:hypothetical protein
MATEHSRDDEDTLPSLVDEDEEAGPSVAFCVVHYRLQGWSHGFERTSTILRGCRSPC